MHFTKDSLHVSNDSERAETMIREYFSAMMDAEGYEVVKKKNLSALKEIKLHRRGSIWFTLWLRGNVMVEGFSVPGDDNITSRMESVVEILTACSAVPFNCGQIAYVEVNEHREEDFGYIWSLTPGVSCAEAWTIKPNAEDETLVNMESVTKEHFMNEDIKSANEFGGFITVYCVNIFETDKDIMLVDNDIKIFAQYLAEKGHDLTFNFDKILMR